MKTFLTICFTILISSVSLAQAPDPVLARVAYHFTHQRDTLSKSNPYTETMLLITGKNASLFTSLDKIERDLDLQKAKPSPSAPFKPVNRVDLYYFASQNKFISRERFMNSYYLIDEAEHKIKWKITKDTASFSGINCQKAITNFKGRNWTAWYAVDLPFQSGPWKLNGLPGLIIEAYDDKKEVVFSFAGIDNLKKENLTAEQLELAKAHEKDTFFFGKEIALQKDAKKTNRADFDKIMELYKKDPIGFISAETGTPRNRIAMGSSATGVSHSVINNPIELPEKK
ncbi:MAG: GLPGLI family protein [Pedobacter sp.]|nr:MAG: GLPGLI family protein [Pedobacter sp.]